MESRREQPPSSATAGGGVVLGKYQLGHLLGRGSFAKVYRARPLCGGAAVAIKVIDKAKTVDAAMEPRIVREVAAMRRLSNHPNILKIHEVMATKTKIYLVMELATGGDLSTKLRRRGGGALPETTARRYFQQIVSALHFCHGHGVTHRDIKPQNLLIDAAGVLKISDFGLSAVPENQLRREMLQTACGTPAYTAPEVFRRRGYDGAMADAWSCGVILFLFLTGNLPFDDSNLAAMYQKIRRREFEFPNWVSKQSKFIIRNLLDPNPNSRMSLETLMGHSWFKKSLPLEFSEEHCLYPQLGVLLDNEKSKFNMNAFDIISMSSGLDLSGLFENNRRERRFTTKASVGEIEERVGEIGGRLGYRVERGKGRSIVLVKGMTVLLVEILAVAAEVAMVVVKVVDGGGVEFEEFHWDDWRIGFEHTVLSLHNDVC